MCLLAEITIVFDVAVGIGILDDGTEIVGTGLEGGIVAFADDDALFTAAGAQHGLGLRKNGTVVKQAADTVFLLGAASEVEHHHGRFGS